MVLTESFLGKLSRSAGGFFPGNAAQITAAWPTKSDVLKALSGREAVKVNPDLLPVSKRSAMLRAVGS
jgi:hypothetical protein